MRDIKLYILHAQYKLNINKPKRDKKNCALQRVLNQPCLSRLQSMFRLTFYTHYTNIYIISCVCIKYSNNYWLNAYIPMYMMFNLQYILSMMIAVTVSFVQFNIISIKSALKSRQDNSTLLKRVQICPKYVYRV